MVIDYINRFAYKWFPLGNWLFNWNKVKICNVNIPSTYVKNKHKNTNIIINKKVYTREKMEFIILCHVYFGIC